MSWVGTALRRRPLHLISFSFGSRGARTLPISILHLVGTALRRRPF